MRIARALVLCLLPSLASAQPVQVLHAFGVSPGAPSGALIEAPDGSFYGTAATGIYRRAPDGQVTLVARVGGAVDALLRGSDGALYGVTKYGGPNAVGTVFRFDPVTGDLRTLHAFTDGNDGGRPFGGLVEVGGQLYGVTTAAGLRSPPAPRAGRSSASIRPQARSPCCTRSATSARRRPRSPWGPLALGPDGMLYGTTRFGGAEEAGTIYRLNPATGAFAIVHAMTGAEGIGPVGPLLLDSDGAFYGSAYGGGNSTGAGTIFRFDPGDEPAAAPVLAHVRHRRVITRTAGEGSRRPPVWHHRLRPGAAGQSAHAHALPPAPHPRGQLRDAPHLRSADHRARREGATGARDRCPALRLRPDRRADRHRDHLSLRSAGRRTAVRPAVVHGAPHVSARSLVAVAPHLVRGRLPVWHDAVRRRDRARARLSSEPGDRRRHAARHAAGRTGADGLRGTLRWSRGRTGCSTARPIRRPTPSTRTASSASIRRPVRPRPRTSAPIRSFRPCSIRLDRWRVCPGRSTDFARRAPASTSSASTRRRTRSLTSRPRRGASWSPTSLLAATDGQLYVTSVIRCRSLSTASGTTLNCGG